jgi:hypothetical protein
MSEAVEESRYQARKSVCVLRRGDPATSDETVLSGRQATLLSHPFLDRMRAKRRKARSYAASHAADLPTYKAAIPNCEMVDAGTVGD